MTTVLIVAAAVGSGVAAGVFLAFSSFVMRALDRVPAAQAIAVMNAINVTVVNAVFLADFLGTGVLSAVLVVLALTHLGAPWAPLVLAGGVLYLVGVVVLTGAFHLPRNDALSRVDPNGPDAAAHWARYRREWTAGNHVRTVLPLVAAVLLTGALLTR